jgi:hypothetical protein
MVVFSTPRRKYHENTMVQSSNVPGPEPDALKNYDVCLQTAFTRVGPLHATGSPTDKIPYFWGLQLTTK